MNPEKIAELKEKARAVRLGIIDALGIDKELVRRVIERMHGADA